MYAIIDAVIDQYFFVLEQISEKMEELEDELMFSSNQKLLNKIYSIKKEIVYLKKYNKVCEFIIYIISNYYFRFTCWYFCGVV